MFRISLVSYVLMALVCGVGRSAPPDDQQPPSDKPPATLTGMLQDPALWGPDYPAAAGAVPAFLKAGEQRVEILPRRVVGHRKFASRGEAQAAAAVAAQAAKTPPPFRVTPPGNSEKRTLTSIAAVDFPDDRTIRVGTPDENAQYLNPNARIDQFEERWGKPETVTKEVVDDGTESRPIEMTLYHFANDSIVIVTTDLTPDPRQVDRVYLDTRAVVQSMF